MLRASKDSMASAVGFSDYRNIEKCVSKKNTSFTFVLTYSAFIYILRHKNYEIIFKVLPLNHNLNYSVNIEIPGGCKMLRTYEVSSTTCSKSGKVVIAT